MHNLSYTASWEAGDLRKRSRGEIPLLIHLAAVFIWQKFSRFKNLVGLL